MNGLAEIAESIWFTYGAILAQGMDTFLITPLAVPLAGLLAEELELDHIRYWVRSHSNKKYQSDVNIMHHGSLCL